MIDLPIRRLWWSFPQNKRPALFHTLETKRTPRININKEFQDEISLPPKHDPQTFLENIGSTETSFAKRPVPVRAM